MGKMKELAQEEDSITEIAKVIAEAEGRSVEDVLNNPNYDPYKDGFDLQSVHARINNNTVLASNIDNRPGTHMGLIQNIIAHEMVRMYKALERIEKEHIVSPQIMVSLRSEIRGMESLAAKIAKAVQSQIRRNKG